MTQRQKHKAKNRPNSQPPQIDEKGTSDKASLQTGLFEKNRFTETGFEDPEMKPCQTSLGLFSAHRYRQITIGLAIVYFVWLAFLAWIAYRVLTA
jgi:hypothetical protein